MAEEQVIEAPEYGTAGLASALQLVDQTGFPVFVPTQSTSVAQNLVAWPILLRLGTREMVRTPLRNVRFETALRDSLRENSEILEELAKY